MTGLADRGLVAPARSISPSAEEQRNIDLAIEFLSAQALSDRSRYTTDDFRSNQPGMQQLCELAGIPDAGPGPHAGYDEKSFSDRRNVIEDYIASGDCVWLTFRMVGTHTGDFWGMPATGNALDLRELVVFRFRDGKIAESWWWNDELAICIQLGIPIGIPSLAEAPPADAPGGAGTRP